MKKEIIIFTFLLLSICCFSQNSVVRNLSENLDLNYIIANIKTDNIIKKELWNGGQYITIFEISDSKATPEDYFDGTDEILSSLIISSTPDGDYYTNSKLYKIEGLNNPKVIEIKEIDYPNFSIKIKYGLYDKREIETLIFEGVQ